MPLSLSLNCEMIHYRFLLLFFQTHIFFYFIKFIDATKGHVGKKIIINREREKDGKIPLDYKLENILQEISNL